MGKTSILNAIQPGLGLRVKAVSAGEQGKGRHTTTHYEMFPLEFGGPDEDVNVVYLPVGLGAMKTRIDMEVVQPLAEEGRITSYTATPEYQGRSFIPVSIRIRASDPGDFTYTLAIWGEALASDEGN